MTEETHDAPAPARAHRDVICLAGGRLVLLIGLTFAIQSYDSATGTDTAYRPADLHRRGRLVDAKSCWSSWSARNCSADVVVTANSRMIYRSPATRAAASSLCTRSTRRPGRQQRHLAPAPAPSALLPYCGTRPYYA